MKNTNLIAFQGETPLFRETEVSNFKSITQRTFTDTMKDFHPVENLKFVWEKAATYLEEIARKKDSKKLKQSILKVTAKDLDFNLQDTLEPSLDLNQKIRSAYKKLKPQR